MVNLRFPLANGVDGRGGGGGEGGAYLVDGGSMLHSQIQGMADSSFYIARCIHVWMMVSFLACNLKIS